MIYDDNNLTQIQWPSAYERDYIVPFMQAPTRQFISNVDTKVYLLKTKHHVFPVTVNHAEYENSYVCSPYTACISYAKEELHKLKQRFLEIPLFVLISLLDSVLKMTRINQVVHVNNWLLSTNLYPDWSGDDIQTITKLLLEKFPQHVIIFRSLNRYTNDKLYPHFTEAGYHLIASRQLYIFNGKTGDYLTKQNTRWDLKLLDKSPYQIISHDDLSEADFPRIVTLYKLLYLDKYSYFNPQFTEQYIRLCHQKKLLTMYGLRSPSGTLDGIVGYFCRNQVMTVPLVGYDTALPQKMGLYRMLMALALRDAHRTGQILNLSSGASHFKILRGGRAYIEHSAVYYQHLPLYRKLPWGLLKTLLNQIGVPIMRKYRL